MDLVHDNLYNPPELPRDASYSKSSRITQKVLALLVDVRVSHTARFFAKPVENARETRKTPSSRDNHISKDLQGL